MSSFHSREDEGRGSEIQLEGVIGFIILSLRFTLRWFMIKIRIFYDTNILLIIFCSFKFCSVKL